MELSSKQILEWKNKLDKKWVLIEIGAGTPLYSILSKTPNCLSQLVDCAWSPTSKTAFYSSYGSIERTVSLEACQQILSIEQIKNPDRPLFISTCQVGNDANTRTHGWILTLYLGLVKWYHWSIDNWDQSYNRQELVETIEKISLDVFSSVQNSTCLKSGYIDNVSNSIVETCQTLINASLSDNDSFIVFKADGTIIPLSEWLRYNSDPVIYKGSFNPLHEAHIKFAQNHRAALMISCRNFDQTKEVTYQNLVNRIKLVHLYGFDVIVNTRPLFFDLSRRILSDPNLIGTLSLLMGIDTFNRLIQSEDKQSLIINLDKCKLIVHSRIGYKRIAKKIIGLNVIFESGTIDVSSTQIRKKLDSKNLNQLDKKYLNNLKKTGWIK